MISIKVQSLAVAGLVIILSLILGAESKSKDERDCEVCKGALNKFKETIDKSVLSDEDKLRAAFRKFCKKIPKGGKENRFCYFVGGTDDAATGILNEVTSRIMTYFPVDKICERLRSMDSQICELRYDVKPDFSKLNKMRVGELKKILSNWGEDHACRGCAEKSDFVKKVKELLSKYEPEEYKKLQKSEL